MDSGSGLERRDCHWLVHHCEQSHDRTAIQMVRIAAKPLASRDDETGGWFD
jgi:hypothetical protein